MKRIFLTALVVFTLTFILVVDVHACGCVVPEEKPSAEEERAALVKDFNGATTVFFGEVVEGDRFKVKFKIERVWKGEVSDEIVMATGAKKHDNGSYSTSSCDYSFKLGEKYLVYAYPVDPDLHPDSTDLQARECTRTKLAKYAEQEIKELDEVQPHEKRGTRRTAASGDPARN